VVCSRPPKRDKLPKSKNFTLPSTQGGQYFIVGVRARSRGGICYHVTKHSLLAPGILH